MHHPTEWLTDWAGEAINTLCYRHFNLVLTGHIHKKDAFYIHDGVDSYVLCSSPQLFSRKSDLLGYSILNIGEGFCDLSIHYRQWAHDRFVAGTSFSKNDTGKLRLDLSDADRADSVSEKYTTSYKHILKRLENNLQKCLKCYTSLPAVWVLPNIADKSEFYSDDETAVINPASNLHSPFRNCIVIAPRQFGLSSLGRYLSLAAWRSTLNQYAMYIDSSELQNHETAIEEYINNRLDELGLEMVHLKAIILDEGSAIHSRKINNIKKLLPNIPLTVLLSKDDSDINVEQKGEQLSTSFEHLYLWSLERAQMRELVRKFIDTGYDLEEDAALQRLVEDIANLNVHRTPLICLTLLAVYSSGIETSPVNRTDMFERFLFLIFFSYKKFPDYSRVPDMKDALAVVGAFCEGIIRRKHNGFRKDEFILSSTKFCKEMSIDVDCSQLFEVMHRENIIVRTGDNFFFRYVHWVYFFGAHRMHHDKKFCSFVLNESYYMNFPEVIEFYSGVDRRREELLSILISDLRNVNEAFENRTRIGADFDPYSAARWTPNGDTISVLKDHLTKEAERSNLPVPLKDQIADRTYDKSVPYDQRIRSFVKDSSLLECVQILRASARALRNSDYVKSDIKEELLNEIMRAWTKQLQVLFLLSPIIAQERFAVFDNIKFFLGPGFEELEGEELWDSIVGSIPGTVIVEHDKDIASPRITPLFQKVVAKGGSGPSEFLLAAVVVRNRPEKWQQVIREFIKNVPKNSFYLLKIYRLLLNEHRYGFMGSKSKESIFELMSMVVAKHETGAKSPNKRLIDKVKSSLREFLEDQDKGSPED